VKRIIAVAAVAVLIVLLISAGSYLQQRRTIRRQLIMADSAVSTVLDYGESGAMAQADLVARDRLDTLDAESLNANEAKAASALRDYLAAIESLESSHSIETTMLRQPIAADAAKKAHQAMIPFAK
jgi:hypothetical protein